MYIAHVYIGADIAPAMGDVRAMGYGDTIHILPGATLRPDWPRYTDAIGIAVTRGAEVRQSR